MAEKRRVPAPEGQHSAIATSAPAHRNEHPDSTSLELATAYAVAWGAEENVIDAWEAGTLCPDLFTDPGHQTIVAAVSGLIAAGEAPLRSAVHDALMAGGRDLWQAARLHAVNGGRAALVAVLPDTDDEARYQALPDLLARLTDEVDQ